jgi:hypothetical protein
VELVVLAASTLVKAMTSDAWEKSKQIVTAWWQRHSGQQVAQGLESARGELAVADEAARQQLTPLLQARWEGRLEALLEDHPEAAADLGTLVEELGRALAEAGTSGTVINSNTGSISGHLIQARDIHGGVRLGPVQNPPVTSD